MPPRRTHKKSRGGCKRCKQRKVKCDEIRPTCGNCLKHGISDECEFDELAATNHAPKLERQSSSGALVKSSSPSSPSHSVASPSVLQASPASSALSNFPATNRLMEMRLLHHYTALTAKTLAAVNIPSAEAAWQISVPTLAFESPCLMDAVLAVSALHLRSLEPNDYNLVRASHAYMASAISQYSACLQKGVDASNAEALFTTSALIAFQASTSRRFMREDSQSDKYVSPLQWFHSFQGVKTVVLASWQWLRDSERVRPIIDSQPAVALDLSPERPAFFAPLLEGLEEDLQCLEDPQKSEVRQAYEHSTAYLNWAHQKPERPRIMGFPATVSRRFVELISNNEPRALAIMACFFAMTKAVDDVWWLQGVAAREVNGIATLLPRDWYGRLEWPLRLANHEGPMNEQTWGACWHKDGDPEVEQGFSGDVRSHIDILANLEQTMPMGV